jgi:hypothetical protein
MKRKWYSVGSVGFLLTVVVVCNIYLFATAEVAQTHLKTEISWSAELLDQNMHTLGWVADLKEQNGEQSRAIDSLVQYLGQLEETIEMQEKVIGLDRDPEIELEPATEE